VSEDRGPDAPPTTAQSTELSAELSSAVWTVPNIISMVRILLIFVFGWLLINEQDLWAIVVLVVAGVSDFLDGFLARRWGQITALGRVLDPTADRILTVVVVLGLAIREFIPWWLVVILLARDVMVGAALLYARARGVESSQVTFVGKLATFVLYVTLPLSVLAFYISTLAHSLAIAAACGAAVLYWISGIGYVRDIASRARERGVGEPVAGAPERLG
jgi:cardiolipin synthase